MKKRIALAAIAALAGGLLVAAPASAVVQGADAPWSITVPSGATWGTDSSTATVSQVASSLGYVRVLAASNETGTGTVVPWVSVAGSTISAHVDASGDTGTVNSAGTKITYANANINGAYVHVATAAAGTITVTTGYDSINTTTGVSTTVTQQTFTITVTAAASTAAYDHSTVAVGTNYSTTFVDASGNVFATNSVGTPAETLTVSQWANAAGTIASDSTASKAITVAVSGVGAVAAGNGTSSTAAYVASAAGGASAQTFTISADGRSGVSTVTVSVNGVVVATKTITFYGPVASYTATIDKAQFSTLAPATVTLTAKDASGITVANASAPAYVASGSTSVATIAGNGMSNGVETFTVTAVAKGTSVLTFANSATAPTVSTTVTANVVTAGFASVAIAFDTATYTPGQKATFTVSAKNSDGVAVGDGTYTLFSSAPVSSANLGGSGLPGTSVALVNGVATFTVYMPLANGPVVVNAKDNTSATNALSASATVAAPVDAAAAAAAAAQAAQITALGTSISSLTTTVAALVASMTAQIKVINATLKTQSLVLAKIKKKLGIR